MLRADALPLGRGGCTLHSACQLPLRAARGFCRFPELLARRGLGFGATPAAAPRVSRPAASLLTYQLSRARRHPAPPIPEVLRGGEGSARPGPAPPRTGRRPGSAGPAAALSSPRLQPSRAAERGSARRMVRARRRGRGVAGPRGGADAGDAGERGFQRGARDPGAGARGPGVAGRGAQRKCGRGGRGVAGMGGGAGELGAAVARGARGRGRCGRWDPGSRVRFGPLSTSQDRILQTCPLFLLLFFFFILRKRKWLQAKFDEIWSNSVFIF